MSIEDKKKILEGLNRDIDEKEKILAGLKIDIQSRQKLLETLNSIDKPGNNKNFMDTLKRQEEEIGTRDRQIMALYQRIEALQKESDTQETKNKANKVITQVGNGVYSMKDAEYEELTKSWEAQKVKYVEEIQNISIELRKKDRILDEKTKAFENTIQGLESQIKDLEGQNTKYVEEIEALKEEINEITQRKDDEIKILKDKVDLALQENETLSSINIKVKESLEEREEYIKKLKDQLLQNEDSIKNLEKGLLEKLDNQTLKDTIKEKEEDILVLRKEVQARKLESENLNNNVNNLLQAQDEKQKIISALNEQLEDMNTKVYNLTQEVLEYKQRELAYSAAKQEIEEKKPEEKETKEAEVQAVENVEEKEMKTEATQTEEIELETSQAVEDEALDREIARRLANVDFEEKLQAIKEENEQEIAKLSQLLLSSQAENQEKILDLEEKQSRLQELENINSTFEELVHGLKRTILEVQGRMDKNSKNLAEMQKKLEEKDEEIMVLRQFEAEVIPTLESKEKENIAFKRELHEKNFQITRLEKNLLQLMEESNMFKVKLKVATDKLSALSKNQGKALSSQLTSKDNEIQLLKDMLKSSQGIIRTKELELSRLKQKLHLEPVSVRLPSIASSENLRKDMKNNLKGFVTKFDKGKPGSEYNYHLRGDIKPPRDTISSGYEGNILTKFTEDKHLFSGDELSHFPEIYKMKETFDENDAELLREFELPNGREGFGNREFTSGFEDSGTRVQSFARNEDLRTEPYQESEIRRKSKKNQPSVFDPSAEFEEDAKNIISPVKVTKRKHQKNLDTL